MKPVCGPGSPPPPVRRRRMPARLLPWLLGWGLLLPSGCGRKGPPVPPVPRRPEPVGELAARQQGDRVLVSFRLPQFNLDGSPARLEEILVLRRLTRIEDAEPERRERLERFFSRTSETAADWRDDAIAAARDESGRVEFEDDGALEVWEPGYLLAYRVLLLGVDSRNWSPSDLVFLEPRAGLKPPAGLRASRVPDGVELDWEPGGSDRRFNVYRVAPDGGVAVRLNPQPLEGSRFVDPEVPAEGVTARYTVRAVEATPHGTVESGDSAPADITTPRLVRPPPPSQVTAAVTGRHIRLVWYPPESEDLGGFRIYRRSPDDPAFVPVAEVAASEVMYTDREVRPGIDYQYRVMSFSRLDPQRECATGETVSARVEEAGTGTPEEGGE